MIACIILSSPNWNDDFDMSFVGRFVAFYESLRFNKIAECLGFSMRAHGEASIKEQVSGDGRALHLASTICC